MLQINDNQVKITAGDTAEIEITIYLQKANLEDDTPLWEQIYHMQEGDKLKFYLLDINREGYSNKNFKETYNAYLFKNFDKPPVLVKEFDNNIIRLERNDTLFLNYGVYLYGCVLETADGEINTIQQGEFMITQRFM